MAGIIESIKFKPSCFSTEGPDESLQYFENTRFIKKNAKTSKKWIRTNYNAIVSFLWQNQNASFVF